MKHDQLFGKTPRHLLALLPTVFLALVTTAAVAGTFTVTNANDSGTGSLRQAILDADAAPGADTIEFEVGLTGQTIGLTSGPLSITSDLTIKGLGRDQLTIDGNGADVFTIDTSGNTVGFIGITIVNGEDGIQISGGAEANNVTVTESRIARQISDDGFEINGNGNTVTVKDTVFSENEDNLAIEGNNNIVTVTDSTSTLAREDGVEIDGNDNTVTVKDTTISNNGLNPFDPNDGLDVDGARNVLHIEQVTFSGNGEDGLDIEGPNNHILVTHSTVTGNGRAGITKQDAALTSSTVVVYNSIIAGNTGPDAVGRVDQVATVANFSSAGYNLVGNGTGSTGFDGPGDQVGTSSAPIDARFGPLQDNGGLTFTHALLPGSPAIDAGDPNFTPPPDFDQRGPGFLRVQNGAIDIGALEAPPPVPPVPPVPCSGRFEIPINTVVRGAPGSEHLVATRTVPAALVGQTCTPIVGFFNNESVHPGSDLLVRSNGGTVTLTDVEREPNAFTSTGVFGELTFGSEVSVVVPLGPDGVFSGGPLVTIRVIPPPPPPPPSSGPDLSIDNVSCDGNLQFRITNVGNTDVNGGGQVFFARRARRVLCMFRELGSSQVETLEFLGEATETNCRMEHARAFPTRPLGEFATVTFSSEEITELLPIPAFSLLQVDPPINVPIPVPQVCSAQDVSTELRGCNVFIRVDILGGDVDVNPMDNISFGTCGA